MSAAARFWIYTSDGRRFTVTGEGLANILAARPAAHILWEAMIDAIGHVHHVRTDTIVSYTAATP